MRIAILSSFTPKKRNKFSLNPLQEADTTGTREREWNAYFVRNELRASINLDHNKYSRRLRNA